MPSPLTRAISSFSPASMPAMSRQSFKWEQLSALFLPMAVACVEANVIAVIAKKAFHASDLSIATLAAAPALSNISSILWTRLIRGRDRVRAVNLMQAGVLLCVASIALAPIGAGGEALLVIATLLARTLLTGIITARTDIWRNNYPRSQRARVTGKLLTTAAIVVAITGAGLGLVMDALEQREPATAASAAANPSPAPAGEDVSPLRDDRRGPEQPAAHDALGLPGAVEGPLSLGERPPGVRVLAPDTSDVADTAGARSAAATSNAQHAPNNRAILSFRAVYLLSALLGLCGVYFFSRVRWRGGPAQRRAELDPDAEYSRSGGGARDMLRLLRDDKAYRSFMGAQFMLGLPNLAGIPVFILALDAFLNARDPSRDHYTQTLLLTQIIPLLVPIVTIPLWARLLDRMHIVRFRVFHSWVFVLANLLMGAGFYLDSLPTLYASRFVLGVAYAGGMLAWDLGHHDFARRDLATLYMGIHVTLTGVRGAIAPFLGALLYSGSLAIPAFTLGGAANGAQPDAPWLRFPGASIHIPALGTATFFVLMVGSIAGALMFLRLDRQLGHRGAKPKD